MSTLSKKQLKKLKEIKKEDLFNIISNPGNEFDVFTWEKILESIMIYNEFDDTEKNIRIEFLEGKDLKIMKNYGLDINYIDEEGNNFLMFIYKINIKMKFQPLNKHVFITKFFLDNIEKETINKTIINKRNESILSILISSYDEKDFIYFKEKYNLDINIVNAYGNSLLQIGMVSYTGDRKIDFLLKNNINIENINKNNQTFLNLICIRDRSEERIELYERAIKEFKEETLILKDNENKTFYEHYIETLPLSSAYGKNYNEYIKQTMEIIIQNKDVQKKKVFCNDFFEKLEENKRNLTEELLKLMPSLEVIILMNEMKSNDIAIRKKKI